MTTFVKELLGKPDYEAFEMVLQAGFVCKCCYNKKEFPQKNVLVPRDSIYLLINDNGIVIKAKFISD